MKIAVGSDEKSKITEGVIEYLKEKGIEFDLFGALKEGEDSKWVSVVEKVATRVSDEDYDQGILFCWTGTGVSMVANKVKGIRAALCHDPEQTRGAKKWNDANILVLSNAYTSEEDVAKILDAWFSSNASEKDSDKRAIDRLNEM